MSITVEPCTPERFEEHFQLCEAAFGRRAAHDEVARWRAVLEPGRVLGARVADQLVGTAGAVSLSLTVPGGTAAVAGVLMVGVLPSHRGRGVFAELMNTLLVDARGRQEHLAVLWASEGGIYRSHGFGLGTLNARIDASVRQVRFARAEGASGSVTISGLDHREALERLPAVYASMAGHTAGAIVRSREWWSQISLGELASAAVAPSNPVQAYVVSVDGHDEAYALIRQHPQYEHRLHHDWVEVLEVVSASASGHRALWSFLFSLSLVENVRAGLLPVDDPLLLSVEQPGRLRVTTGDGLWVRILDVAALSRRRYNGSGTLVLRIKDPLLPENDGCWRLDVEEGTGAVTRVSSPPEVVLGVDALASAYLGAFSFEELERAQLVQQVATGAIARASALFSTARAPWCPEVI